MRKVALALLTVAILLLLYPLYLDGDHDGNEVLAQSSWPLAILERSFGETSVLWNGPAQTAIDPQQLDTNSPTNDFEFDIAFGSQPTVPDSHQEAIRALFRAQKDSIALAQTYVVTVEIHDGDWSEYVLVPREDMLNNWSAYDPARLLRVGIDQDGRTERVTARFLETIVPSSETPKEISEDETMSQSNEIYKFPWRSGQTWELTNSWHPYWKPESLDFAPSGTNSSDVIAAASGKAFLLCNDHGQAYYQVNNSDGFTLYLHLTSVDPSIHNKDIERGQFLGSLYDGTYKSEPQDWACDPNDYSYELKWNSKCGCGTGPHLHFRPPSKAIEIDGKHIDSEVAQYPGRLFASTNVQGSDSGEGSYCTNNEQPGRDEVILFDEPNFGPGPCARLQIGDYADLGAFQLDDKASSVRVGEDVDVVLFKDKNFGEPSEKIESDHVNLDIDSDVRKNEASSAKVIQEGNDDGGDDGGQGATCTDNQAPAADEVILFDEPNFGAGPCARLKIGDYSNLGEFEMDDRASSVRVGADVDVILYKNQGFGEPSQKIENDHVNLDDNSNVKKNEASSARVRHEDDSDDGGGGQGDICQSNEKPDADEVILFDEPHFGAGPCARLKIGEYNNLGQFEMNDKASSIRVGEDVDVEIFEHKDFGGDHQKIENDHVNLDDYSNVRKNEASSAKVFREGSDGGGGNCGNPGPSQAAIFDGEDYGGACLILEMGQYPDFHDLPIDLNDMVSSIKTGSLVRLKLYEHQNYNGDRSGRMSEFGAGTSDPDLTDNAIKKNAASSAKVYFVLGAATVYPIENNDGDGGFPITWSSVQHAEMYDIYEQFNSGGWNAIADDYVGLSLDRSGLAPGTWCYKVRAANFGHSGPESNTVCTTVVPPPEPPETPQLLDIDNSDEDGQFMVQWEQAANTETYELQENWNSGSWDIAYVGPDRFAGRIDRGSGEWCYRTKAHGPGGSSEWSATKCATVAESISPPEVPTLNPIDNTDMDGAYTVSWTAVSGADLYQLEEQHGLQGWSLAYEGVLIAFDASGRGQGDWCYRVKAQGPGGASDWSPVVCTSVEADAEEPPDAPSLNAIDNPGNTGSFIVSWAAAADSEAFALQRNHNGGNWLSIYSGALTSVQQSNLAEGSWCYRVQAVKGGLSSPWSNTVCTFAAGSTIDVETLFLPLVQR